MKIHAIIFLLVLLGCGAVYGQITGKVVGVHDGDSITLLTGDNKQIKVRLRSIDCPELGQPFGRNAKQYTSAQAFGKTVQLADTGLDRYGRTLATVLLPNGDTLNNLLVAGGYAWQYTQYDSSKRLQDLQYLATTQKLGLWQSEAVAPWLWRKTKHR